MKVPSLRAQAAATVAVLAAGFALVFFYAPLDTEGFIQKIFYLHVPLAICALAGFVVAGIHAIRLAPVDGTALAAAKATALVVYLLVLEAIAVPVFGVFFLDSWAGLAPLAGVLALADLGLAATGVLVSAIAANSRARDLLVPLVLLPLLVPVMIAAAGASEPLLAAGGPSYDGIAKWLAILALYDVTFLLVGYAVYDFLLED